MKNILQQIWQDKICTGQVVHDPHQMEVVQALDHILDDLMQRQSTPKPRFRFSKKNNSPVLVKGLYIHGHVGRGKSMLMDLFHQKLQASNIVSKRCHFHEFMYQVPLKLKENKSRYAKAVTPLWAFAEDIKKQTSVLCFDEFQVTNIADAMIMSKLFDSLFKQGITLIATSNVAPQDLYKDGLHRSRFLPFIDILQQYTKVINLDGNLDHRMQQQTYHHQHWFFPRSQQEEQKFFEAFNIKAASSHNITIAIGSYTLTVMYQQKDKVMVDYKELFQKPRGVKEYAYLCQNFQKIYLYGLPQLTDEKEAARRFIHFIDIAYEYNTELFILAEMPLKKLQPPDILDDIFTRTASRLNALCNHI